MLVLSCPVLIHQEQGPLLLFSSPFFLFLIPSFPDPSIAQQHAVALLCRHARGTSPLACAALWGFLPLHPCHLLLILLVMWCGVYCSTASSFSCIFLAPLLVVCLSCVLPHTSPKYPLAFILPNCMARLCLPVVLDGLILSPHNQKQTLCNSKNTVVQTRTRFDQSNCRGLFSESSLPSNLLKRCY